MQPAVHSVDEHAFSGPDLLQGRHFYTNFGLDVRDEGGTLDLYTYGHPHRWARILLGETMRRLWLSLGVHSDDLPRYERHLAARTVRRIAAPSETALAKSGAGGLHHSRWCMRSVGLGSFQMAQAGFSQGWGVGRHVLGSNYFRYVCDPYDSFAEYTLDIDLVELRAQWPSANHPGEDRSKCGAVRAADFIVNHEQPAV